MPDFFLDCITEKLGPVKAKEAADRYKALLEQDTAPGNRQRAMERILAERQQALATKARVKLADLEKLAERKQRFEDFDYNDAVFGKTNANADAGQVVKAMLERDPRAKATNYFDTKAAFLGRMWAIADAAIEHMGKGTLGLQKGKAYEENVIREMLGEHTGDHIAKHIADGLNKAGETGVDMFNAVGGAMNKISGGYLPQRRSIAKLTERGLGSEDYFVKAHSEGGSSPVDWDRMRWPDGSAIRPEQREDALRETFRTLVTDGRNKIKDDTLRGQGASVGKQTDAHRFIIYKNADAWLAAHSDFGEGSVVDIMNAHFDQMAHQMAMVQIFGSNPRMGFDQAKTLALKKADARVASGEMPGGYVERTQRTLMRAEKMFTIMNRENPLAVESTQGHLIAGASNVLTAAMLGSVPLLGIADDMTKMGIMRLFNHTDLRPFAAASDIMKTWLTDRENAESMLTQAGLVMGESVQSNYATQRFGNVAQYAPYLTRRLSDLTMRASGMAAWTKSAKGAAQMEFMGMLGRDAGKEFHELPYTAMMQRYGIGPAEWDKMRQTPLYDPVEGKPFDPATDRAPWLRPIDALDHHGVDGGLPVYTKFQNMILAETRYAIPENTVEAQVALRDTTRPDSLAGAMLSSFAMFKNFPVTMLNQYGRLAMSNPDRSGRLAFIAGLGVTMSMVGALGLQLRELSKGRDPLPMNTPTFLAKAFLAGGSLSIYGDFLLSNVNEYGHTVGEQLGGPLAAAATDATQLALGDTFQWVQDMQKGQQLHAAKAPAELVQFMKHYTPGTSLWWARLALEREVWDRLAQAADPRAYNKFQKAVQTARKNGNDYWLAPGASITDARMPNFGNAVQ